MRYNFIKFNILCLFSFLFVCILFLGCPDQESSSSGGSSGSSSSESSDDSIETSFKKTVDSAGDVGWDTSIAVDSSNVYISYYDDTNKDLKFAKSTDGGNTWDAGNIKTVDSVGDVGWYTSIAVDGLNVYISYCDYTNGDLKFAKSIDGGNTWDSGNIKTVDSVGDVGWYTSIAVDGLNVYISYYDYTPTNYDLKFAKSTDGGNTWDAGNIKTVDSEGDVGWYTSIAVDGLNVYISYCDYTNGDLKFAKSIDGGNTWDSGNIKTVDSVGDVGKYTSLTVDGLNVYISYYDYTTTNKDLKFAKSTDGGNTWDAGNIKTVDSVEDVGWYTSIAVDGLNVYVSYYDFEHEDLKFAKSTDGGNTWDSGNIKTVDSTGSVGKYTSIAIDGSNVYISYYDSTNDDLKFAKSTDGGNTWDAGNIKTVDSSIGYVGLYASIAVDGANVYISYYDYTNGYLKFARSVDRGNTW